jgi:Ca-activated chloride channel family protein
LSFSAFGQNGAEDVHISPLQPVGAKAGPGVEGDLRARVRPIIKDVDLVLVPVTVTDDMARPVTGLEKQYFAVYEGQAKQRVQYFSAEDAPITVGIIFDASSSMSDKMEEARAALAEFFKTANPQDEFFLIAFSDRPELIADFDTSPEDIQSKLMLVAPQGRTALHDAVYLGLSKASQAHYSRRALLIISDGGDNHSRYSERELMEFAKEADTPIYAIGIHRAPGAREERLGSWMLSEMTKATGGYHFTIERPQDLADVATKIGYMLRNQYVLGYRPDNPLNDGKWRKIKVKLQVPEEIQHWTIYAKTGYYARTK